MKHMIKIGIFLLVILIVVGLLLIYARFIEPNLLHSKRTTITTDKVSEKSVKIVMIGDTHFRKDFKISYADRLVEEINQHKPDLLLFVGDLMESYAKSRPDTEAMTAALGKMEARYGKFAVYGNHDRGGGASRVYEGLMEQGGFHVLVNETRLVEELNINLMGVDDVLLGKPDREIGKRTLVGAYNILLSHEPDFVDSIALTGIDLVTSGHTHGGQVRLPFFIKQILPTGGKNYLDGLYELNQEGSQLYVTTGIGMATLPVRMGNVPEVVAITLEGK